MQIDRALLRIDTAVLRIGRAVLRIDRALCSPMHSKYVAGCLCVYVETGGSFTDIFRALLRIDRAFVQIDGALLRIDRALLRINRALCSLKWFDALRICSLLSVCVCVELGGSFEHICRALLRIDMALLRIDRALLRVDGTL